VEYIEALEVLQQMMKFNENLIFVPHISSALNEFAGSASLVRIRSE
jgi:hypothetical protein